MNPSRSRTPKAKTTRVHLDELSTSGIHFLHCNSLFDSAFHPQSNINSDSDQESKSRASSLGVLGDQKHKLDSVIRY